MRILELTVQNVRGLSDLHLQLDGKNIVIWGPNGAGKSSVVDAIEFLFTGRISRLMGEGTAGISLSRHGHHIDHEAESASVTATLQLEGNPQPIELRRCMAQPDQLDCPDDAKKTLAKAGDIMRRGGVVLTRKDILRYVAAEAGKRADEIEELLHLEGVDDVRSSLYRARTEMGRKEKSTRDAIETAKAEVNVTLGLTTYSDEGLIQAVNNSRQTLGGEPLEVRTSNKFKEGIAPEGVGDTDPVSIDSSQLQQAIQNIRREAPPSFVPGLLENDRSLRANITNLRSNPGLLAELERLQLTEYASRFVDDLTVECPLCGASWPEGNLKTHLEVRIATARTAEVIRDDILKSAETIAMPTRTLWANANFLAEGLRTAEGNTRAEDLQVLDDWRGSLAMLLEVVTEPIERYLNSDASADEVSRLFVPENLNALLDRVEEALQNVLPITTPEQTAWDKLTRLQESVRILENRTTEQDIAVLHSERSKILFAEYEKARDTVLQGMYSRIADRFVQFYRFLHAHEGDHFSASIQPQRAGLTFEVDFMGRGNHPPHALHSEGHQDSMGVCLFLALNEELAKGGLGLIVLDDVMMSVDTGHRKDVCRLFAEEFTECQFVITTHDRTWATQLKQEGVVEDRQIVEFTGWSVERGPSTNRQLDLWGRIQAHLEQEDVNGAAFRLRRGSEDFFEDVCSALGAQITYNSRMQWQLDDWLPAAMYQYRDLIMRGRRAATSWNDQDAVTIFDELESVRKQIYGRIHVEQWSINASIHYNNWENMSKEDFLPVVDALRALQSLFKCSTCGGLLEKLPPKGNPETAKCPCGKVSWNLRQKPGTG